MSDEPVVKKALDGGPISNMKFTGVRLHNLVTVELKESPGQRFKVRKDQYEKDRERYRRVLDVAEVEADADAPPAKKSKKKPAIDEGPRPPAEELGQMTGPALRGLPEYLALPEPRPMKKSEIVTAILEARQAAAE